MAVPVALAVALAIALAVALSGLSACGRQAPRPSGSGSASTSGADLAGAPPRRIVSLAPSTTELCFAVGAGERVVGVTTACDYPAAALALPRVGAYNQPSVELVLALEPDLVLVPQEGDLLGPVEQVRSHGVRVEAIAIASLEDLYAACARAGALCGEAERGRALGAHLRAREQAVRARVAGLPRPRALLVVDHRPTVAAGQGTFAAALLDAAGAADALGPTRAAWPQLSLEAIAACDPAVVIDTSMADLPESERVERQRALWALLPSVTAVREGRVHALEPALLVRPGPRLLDGLEALAETLHGEAARRPR